MTGASDQALGRLARGIRLLAIALPVLDAVAIAFFLSHATEPLLVAGTRAGFGLAARIVTVVLLLRAVADLEGSAGDAAARARALERVKVWALVSVVLLLATLLVNFGVGFLVPPDTGGLPPGAVPPPEGFPPPAG